MSNVSKPCNIKPSSETLLMAYDDCNLEHEVSVKDLELVPETDVEWAIANSPIISNLKAKDQQLQSQIDNINNVKLETLTNAAQLAKTTAENAKAEVDGNTMVIGEIQDNIAMLKGWNVRQDAAIKWLNTRVVIDTIYNNFEEWVENVYIPQSESIANKFTRWDLYINANQDIAATNATYIHKGMGTNGASANDWQELYYSAPADVITYLGIDPLVVTHPYKHEWTVNIDPYKFQDFMANLKSLDLSKVELSLGEVYFDPIFKESAKIQEDLEVGNTTKTKELEVSHKATIKEAEIDTAVIPTITGATAINGKVTISGGLEADDLTVTDKATINKADIKTLDVDTFTGTTTFTGKNTFTAGIDVDEINVSNKAVVNHADITTAEVDRFTADTKFEGKATFTAWADVDNLNVSGTATIKNAKLTGSTSVERFDGEVDLSDNVKVGGSLNVTWPAEYAGSLKAKILTATETVALPTTAHITVNGQNFETWLVNFGNSHWQQK